MELYIGIMSGTSLDGVDVVLCEINKHDCKLLSSYEHPFPVALKENILHLIENVISIQEVGELDQKLGMLFADAVNTFMKEQNVDPKQIKAIGSHGQTLWHQPQGENPFSMQLGDPNVISTRTGMKVVADFRRKDVALGGNGAPFAPAFHQFLFGNADASVSIVNIGGMANITVLGKKLIGYDTGCGNVLMDMWIAKHKGITYDKDGVWAKSGKVEYTLLDAMLEDDYFKQSYPKSTGREKFNEAWLEQFLEGKAYKSEDIQRTLLELTAMSISNEVLKFNNDILMLCGGGAKNSFLVERLAILMPNIQVGIVQYADTLEAMAFAWLAYKRLHNEHVNLKEVTGARANGILGGVYV